MLILQFLRQDAGGAGLEDLHLDPSAFAETLVTEDPELDAIMGLEESLEASEAPLAETASEAHQAPVAETVSEAREAPVAETVSGPVAETVFRSP